MYRLTARIEIASEKQWILDKVTEVAVTCDMEQLTDTCTVTLPKRIKWNGKAEIPIRRGDAIRVWLGYNDELEPVFNGYIRDIGIKTPVTLTCEDEMFRLKTMPTRKLAYRSVTIERLLKDQSLPYKINVMGEQHLGAYRVTADTVAGLLGHLAENGIRSFFRTEGDTPTLYCGVLFEKQKEPSQAFATGVNIVSDASLEVERAENIRLNVRAISLMPDNTKIKIECGDDDGERRTLHCYNKTEPELRAWAEQEIKRLKRDGLKGTLTTFGRKIAHVMSAVSISIDGRRLGVYQVKKNNIKYGLGGYRQEITPGARLGE